MTRSQADYHAYTIWMYWHDGWDNAPEVVQLCLKRMRFINKHHRVMALSQDDLKYYFDKNILNKFALSERVSIQALSDFVRIALLKHYGGIWSDATVYCNSPVDQWLDKSTGFFAFSKPTPDRLVASWFLFGERDNLIIERWYERVLKFWKNKLFPFIWASILPSDSYRYKLRRVNYYWFHELFNEIYYSEAAVRELWDSTIKIGCDIASRQGPHFFVSYQTYLTNSYESAEALKVIKEQKEKPPVYKLTSSVKDSIVLSYLMETVLEF